MVTALEPCAAGRFRTYLRQLRRGSVIATKQLQLPFVQAWTRTNCRAPPNITTVGQLQCLKIDCDPLFGSSADQRSQQLGVSKRASCSVTKPSHAAMTVKRTGDIKSCASPSAVLLAVPSRHSMLVVANDPSILYGIYIYTVIYT